MKTYIENGYTAPYICVNEEGYIYYVSEDTGYLADYGGYSFGDGGVDFWDYFENFSEENLIGEKENIEKFSQLANREIEGEDEEEFLLSLKLKIDGKIVYTNDDDEDEEEDEDEE